MPESKLTTKNDWWLILFIGVPIVAILSGGLTWLALKIWIAILSMI